jgi:hypothetical protein
MRKKSAPRRRTSSGPSVAGNHAFRFDGYSMVAGQIPYYIVGTGLVTLAKNLTLSGQQTSSTTPLAATQANPATILVCNYKLTGSYTFNVKDGTGTATIQFDPVDPGDKDKNCAAEIGTFSLVSVGSNRFWLISTGAKLLDGTETDEVVQIEAIRIV